MPRTPRSNLAIENAHRSGGAAAQPVVVLPVIGDCLAEGAIAVNARRAVTYVNRLAEGLLGMRAEALIGRDVVSLATNAPGSDRPSRFERALVSVLETGVEQVLAVNATDAPPFNVDYCRILPIADGGALVLLGEEMSPSVAEQLAKSRALAGILQHTARLSAVAKVQLAMSRTELRDVYAEIYRAVVASLPDAPCFALLLADPAARLFRPQLVSVAGVVTWAPALPLVPFGECAATRALESGSPVSSDHPRRSWASLVPGATPDAPVASELAAPIVHGEHTLGVVIVQSHRRGVFTADDTELLSIIARQAGAAIDNARLFEAQRSERELAEAAARIARAALESTTPAEAAAAILAVLDEVVPTSAKAIGVISRSGAITYIGGSGAAHGTEGLEVPLDQSVARQALHAGDARRAAASDTPAGRPPDHALARDGVVLPLAAKSRMLGVLTAAGGGSPLTAFQIDSLRRLAASVALAIDVQLLSEGERHRRARERMLATALATMDQPVLIISLAGRVLYANDAAVREYGHALDELTCMSLDALVASATLPLHRVDLPTAPAEVLVAEHVHRRRDGSQFPAMVALSVIRDDGGAAVGQVLSVRNLTNERRVAEQLRQSEKLAALGELVAGVAHELNNPLAGISAFAQLLLEEPLTEEQRESARLIKREADRAVGVIRDLLLFSRKSGPSTAPIDLNALIQLTLRLRAYSLRSSGITAETHLDPSLPRVAGDDQKLQQVLLNLIVNAEYAMQRTTARHLVIRTAREGDAAVIEVTDTGTGMAEDTLQRIFEPFFTTKPAGEGTGLGLSVSYGIVEAHGGTIAVESEPGRGTTFRVVFQPVASE